MPLPPMVRTSLKWLGRLLLGILLLLLLLVVLLQTPFGKNQVRKLAVNYLSKKWQTKVAIGSLEVSWLSGIQLTGVRIEDRQHRPMLLVDTLAVQYSLSDIFSKRLKVGLVRIHGASIALYRPDTDSSFNVDFLAAAFASPEPANAAPPSTSPPFALLLGRIDVQRLHLLMEDAYGGQFVDGRLQDLQAALYTTDINQLHFGLRYLHTDSLQLSLRMRPSLAPPPPPDTSILRLLLQADTLSLQRTHIVLHDSATRMNLQAHAALLALQGLAYRQADSMAIDAGTLLAESLDARYQYTSQPAAAAPDTATAAAAPLRLALQKLLIRNSAFALDDAQAPAAAPNQFSAAHMALSQLQADIDAIRYTDTGIQAQVYQVQAKEKSGFELRQLAGLIHYQPTGISLQNLVLQTNRNLIKGQMQLQYPSLDALTQQPGKARVNATIAQGQLVLDDMLYFSPDLRKNPNVQALLGKTFYLQTNISGPVNDLRIPRLQLREAGNTLQASAIVRHLPHVDALDIVLNLQQLVTTKKDLLALLPRQTIPDNMLHYIPDRLRLQGTYSGTMQAFATNLQLQSTLGNAILKGTWKNITEPTRAAYDGTITVNQLRLDKMLQDTSLGAVSGSITVRGTSYDLPTAQASFSANLASARYGGYNYSNITASGTLNKQVLQANLSSTDPNAALSGNIRYDMHPAMGSLATNLNIQHLNLQALGLYPTDTLMVSGKVTADLPVLDTAQLVGTLALQNLQLQKGSNRLGLDSIFVNARHASDSQFIDLTSPYLDAALHGRYTLSNLPQAAAVAANRYFIANSPDTVFARHVQAHLEAHVHLPDSMLVLVPGLKKLAPFTVEAGINTDSNQLAFLTRIPYIAYQDIQIDTALIGGIKQDKRSIYGDLMLISKVTRITTPSFSLAESFLLGGAERGTIDASIILLDEQKKMRYGIPFRLVNDYTRPYLSLKDTIILKQQRWQVNPDNRIFFDLTNPKGSNLQLTSGNASLMLQASDSTGYPLKLAVQNFDLQTITDLVIADSSKSLAQGKANGEAYLISMSPMQVAADMRIDSLQVMGIAAGNLHTVMAQPAPDQYDAQVALLGFGNNATLQGNYNTTTQMVDVQASVKRFDLANVASFANDYVSSMSGAIMADISAKGPLLQPNLTGFIQTDSVQAIYKGSNTYFALPAEKITLSDHDIRFTQFRVYDSLKNAVTFTGGLQADSVQGLTIDLNAQLQNWRAVGHKKFAEQFISGPAALDGRIAIQGNTDEVKVNGQVALHDSSNVFYTLSSEESIQQGDGIIEFIDRKAKPDSLAMVKAQQKKVLQIAISMYLKVTSSSKLGVILDEISGDHFEVQGNADLNLTQSAGGDLQLTGDFTAESGLYDLSIANVIRKAFKVQKGSRIVWSGDPLKANMDVTALYQVKTTAGELVTDVTTVPGITKQKLAFDVYLMLSKEILKPEIQFKIDMPENQQNAFDGVVYNRVKQINNVPSELNKQVMGLLAINHFIADNPFSSLSGGTNLQLQAITTAGQFITQQLTDFAGNIIKGVDIDFGLDVNEDYANGSGKRNTDLKVGMSKSLAKNRLKVYVGNSFALESSTQRPDALAGLASDVTLEYLLSSDGRYRLKGFKVTENDITLNGTIIKTGATYVMNLEFNKLKNAFRSKKKKRKTA